MHLDLDNENQIKKVYYLKNFIFIIHRYFLLDEPVTDLIDLSSPGTHRSDVTQSEIGIIQNHRKFPIIKKIKFLETQRQKLSQIPSLQQLINTAAVSLIDQENNENQLSPKDYDDPIVHHLLRYSELVSNDLESKPITEKMDHWYLDLKKNLMVKFIFQVFIFLKFFLTD